MVNPCTFKNNGVKCTCARGGDGVNGDGGDHVREKGENN